MNLKEVNSVYLLGIGGIGMSALARYFHLRGAKVSGYDKTPSPLTDQLISEGIECVFTEDSKSVNSEADLFIYTPAIPKEHPAFDYVKSLGRSWYKRSEVLQLITEQSKTVAVAGTHGKTTTTAILAHLLHSVHGKTAAFVGGVMTNYQSNLIACENPELTVVEADEYDRSFLKLQPEIAVITSLDPDHLDIYGTFDAMISDYQTFASQANRLIVHESIENKFEHPNKKTYGFGNVNYQISGVSVVNGAFQFTWNGQAGLNLALPGKHNVENASAALCVGAELGVDLTSEVASFKGVKRRFERVFYSKERLVIDDYAHHPKEIEAAIKAARMLFPDNKIAVVFQPHLFTRTRDLEDGFVESLSLADEVVLLPIYPARELPIEGVSSANLLKKLPLKTKQLVEKSHLVNTVISLSAETVLMLGAGDIDRLVQPVVNQLNQSTHVE